MRWPQTLRGQVIVRVIAVLLALLVVLGLFQYVFLARYLRSKAADSLRQQARSALMKPPFTATANDEALLARSLSSPGTSVVILDETGRRLADAGPDADSLQPALPSRTTEQPTARESAAGQFSRDLSTQTQTIAGQTWLIVPVRLLGHEPRATAFLARSTREIDASLNFLAFLTALGSLVGLAVALLASWHLLGGALRPLNRLVHTAGAIADGDWDRRVQIGGSREIDQAATAFNHMVDHLQVAFQAEREQQERMRRFVADAAHELRTPLTALNGFVEIMQAGAVQEPAAQQRALAAMHGEGQRMSRLVRDLLQIARLDARSELPVTSLDLSELLQSLQPALQAADQAHPVTLQTDGPAPVLGNGDGLKQVVWNLVENARRYSPTGSAVALACRTEGGCQSCRAWWRHTTGTRPFGPPQAREPQSRSASPATREHAVRLPQVASCSPASTPKPS